jgi:hypothetical protein
MMIAFFIHILFLNVLGNDYCDEILTLARFEKAIHFCEKRPPDLAKEIVYLKQIVSQHLKYVEEMTGQDLELQKKVEAFYKITGGSHQGLHFNSLTPFHLISGEASIASLLEKRKKIALKEFSNEEIEIIRNWSDQVYERYTDILDYSADKIENDKKKTRKGRARAEALRDGSFCVAGGAGIGAAAVAALAPSVVAGGLLQVGRTAVTTFAPRAIWHKVAAGAGIVAVGGIEILKKDPKGEGPLVLTSEEVPVRFVKFSSPQKKPNEKEKAATKSVPLTKSRSSREQGRNKKDDHDYYDRSVPLSQNEEKKINKETKQNQKKDEFTSLKLYSKRAQLDRLAEQGLKEEGNHELFQSFLFQYLDLYSNFNENVTARDLKEAFDEAGHNVQCQKGKVAHCALKQALDRAPHIKEILKAGDPVSLSLVDGKIKIFSGKEKKEQGDFKVEALFLSHLSADSKKVSLYNKRFDNALKKGKEDIRPLIKKLHESRGEKLPDQFRFMSEKVTIREQKKIKLPFKKTIKEDLEKAQKEGTSFGELLIGKHVHDLKIEESEKDKIYTEAINRYRETVDVLTQKWAKSDKTDLHFALNEIRNLIYQRHIPRYKLDHATMLDSLLFGEANCVGTSEIVIALLQSSGIADDLKKEGMELGALNYPDHVEPVLFFEKDKEKKVMRFYSPGSPIEKVRDIPADVFKGQDLADRQARPHYLYQSPKKERYSLTPIPSQAIPNNVSSNVRREDTRKEKKENNKVIAFPHNANREGDHFNTAKIEDEKQLELLNALENEEERIEFGNVFFVPEEVFYRWCTLDMPCVIKRKENFPATVIIPVPKKEWDTKNEALIKEQGIKRLRENYNAVLSVARKSEESINNQMMQFVRLENAIILGLENKEDEREESRLINLVLEGVESYDPLKLSLTVQIDLAENLGVSDIRDQLINELSHHVSTVLPEDLFYEKKSEPSVSKNNPFQRKLEEKGDGYQKRASVISSEGGEVKKSVELTSERLKQLLDLYTLEKESAYGEEKTKELNSKILRMLGEKDMKGICRKYQKMIEEWGSKDSIWILCRAFWQPLQNTP